MAISPQRSLSNPLRHMGPALIALHDAGQRHIALSLPSVVVGWLGWESNLPTTTTTSSAKPVPFPEAGAVSRLFVILVPMCPSGDGRGHSPG
jgi:hypothetical protein